MDKHVEKLIEAAANSVDQGLPDSAMKYAQAALNAANALAQIESVRRLKSGLSNASA